MAIQSTKPAAGSDPHDLSTDYGRRAFAAHLQSTKQRQQRMQTIKVATVWFGLLILVILVFWQLHVDPTYMMRNAPFVLQGAWTTIGVSLAAIAIATIIALFGALGRLSVNPLAYGVSTFYVSILRGTPLLVQIYIIYLGLPQIGKQVTALGYPVAGKLFVLDALQSGILALSLNYGAYMTEIFRAGIQSISGGQWQAAFALGFNRFQTLHRIILPQAIRIIIPAIGNQFIAMQKDSSLVSVMGIWEITYRANRFARKDSMFMEMFLLAALLYWVLTILSEYGQGWLEARMAKSDPTRH